MKKFRVLSDLHLDINADVPLELKDKDTFAVICGDTAGETEIGIDWIKNNIKSGVLVSGNHLPYNKSMLTIQEQRESLAAAFSSENDITYLDTECKTFYKEVDGILFIGTCMYSDMKISTPWNPDGDIKTNCRIAERQMNDYHYGLKTIQKNEHNEIMRVTHIKPQDYADWFKNAYQKIDAVISANESLAEPKPVVLITHFPIVKKLLQESFYVDNNNLASYGSDYEKWIHAHPSIKCYCCGHAHEVSKPYRIYNIDRADGSRCLVVSNTRGYARRGHDVLFNPNTFVDVETWTVEEYPETPEETERKKKMSAIYYGMSAFFC